MAGSKRKRLDRGIAGISLSGVVVLLWIIGAFELNNTRVDIATKAVFGNILKAQQIIASHTKARQFQGGDIGAWPVNKPLSLFTGHKSRQYSPVLERSHGSELVAIGIDQDDVAVSQSVQARFNLRLIADDHPNHRVGINQLVSDPLHLGQL